MRFTYAAAVIAIVVPLSLLAAPSVLSLPKETDTISLGRSAKLIKVQGQMYRVALEPVTDGATVNPGDVLLVPKGTAFGVGQSLFRGESHGDRLVRIE
jgi:hypothetical protein